MNNPKIKKADNVTAALRLVIIDFLEVADDFREVMGTWREGDYAPFPDPDVEEETLDDVWPLFSEVRGMAGRLSKVWEDVRKAQNTPRPLGHGYRR